MCREAVVTSVKMCREAVVTSVKMCREAVVTSVKMCREAVVTYFEKRMTRESVKTADISRYLPNTIRKIIQNTSRERYCYASLTGRLRGLLTDMVCVHLTAIPLVGLPTLLWPMELFFS